FLKEGEFERAAGLLNVGHTDRAEWIVEEINKKKPNENSKNALFKVATWYANQRLFDEAQKLYQSLGMTEQADLLEPPKQKKVIWKGIHSKIGNDLSDEQKRQIETIGIERLAHILDIKYKQD
ncbi:MAG: hypothetical protein AABY26_05865, partial [Nanoarchaeota archaeon]